MPEPGEDESGLAGTLGADRAARFHLECILLVMAKALRLKDTEVFVYFSPAERRAEIQARVMSRFGKFEGRFVPQRGADLGERIHSAFTELKELGFARQVVLATGSPTIPFELLERAVEELAGLDCVVGPTWSGSYYLIGVKRPEARMFKGVPWGSGRELEWTHDTLTELGFKCLQLPRWQGTDSPDDLPFLEGQVRSADYNRLRSILEG